MRIKWHGATAKRKPHSGEAGQLAAYIGERVHSLRQEKQSSMRDVANGSGLSVAFICQIENGQSMPSAYTLWRLAKVFGVTVDFFFLGFKR